MDGHGNQWFTMGMKYSFSLSAAWFVPNALWWEVNDGLVSHVNF